MREEKEEGKRREEGKKGKVRSEEVKKRKSEKKEGGELMLDACGD